jgi:hypothetical protein
MYAPFVIVGFGLLTLASLLFLGRWYALAKSGDPDADRRIAGLKAIFLPVLIVMLTALVLLNASNRP